MHKVIPFVVAAVAAVLPACAEPAPGGAQKESSTQILTNIKSVWVAPLGSDADSELIRQKLINRLGKSGIFEVVEARSDADAALMGAAEINHRHRFFANIGSGTAFVTSHTRYSGECVTRLVAKDGRTLWADESTSTRFVGSARSVQGASGNVADKTVNNLVKAFTAEKNKLASDNAAAVLH